MEAAKIFEKRLASWDMADGMSNVISTARTRRSYIADT